MKKGLIVLSVVIASASLTYAAPACTDLSSNLSRYAESKAVLSLQNFLYAKGFLKATPNGYFGAGTWSAVRLYQGNRGISQTGTVGPLTRAMIKSDSCSTSSQPLPAQTQTTVQTEPTPSPLSLPPISYPRPMITSYDLVTLFSKGITDWGFYLYGSGFSTTSNSIMFKNTGTGRMYSIGTAVSATGTSLLLPASLTSKVYSCGTGCSEQLPSGYYEIYVTTSGGQSDPKSIAIQPFTLSVQNLATNTLPASATSNKLAMASFSAPIAVIVRSVTFDTGSSTISGGGLSVNSYKDELEGTAFAPDEVLAPFATAVVGVYAATSNAIPGNIWGKFSVTVEDFVGKRKTTFKSDDIMATVAGVI